MFDLGNFETAKAEAERVIDRVEDIKGRDDIADNDELIGELEIVLRDAKDCLSAIGDSEDDAVEAYNDMENKLEEAENAE